MKKITTLLLALLLVIPAMADKTIYLTPGPWDVDGAAFWVHNWGSGTTVDLKMTDSDSDGVYEVAVPDNNINIIFVRMNPSATEFSWSDGIKWNQTGDLKIEGEKNHYTITGWGNYDGYWSVYGSTDEPDPILYIRGYMNTWGLTTMDYDATAETFTWTGDISTGNEFKFDSSGSWADGQNYGYGNVDAAGTYPLVNGGGNIKWNGTPGNITIKVDKGITTMTIVQNSSSVLTSPDALWLRGIDGNWDPGIEMTKEGDTFMWTGEVAEKQEFKFYDGSNWLSVGGDIEQNTKYTFGSGDNTVWSQAGTITFVVDYTDVANPTFTAKDFVASSISYEENITPGNVYYMIPSDEWKSDNAWFAAYFFNMNTGENWLSVGEMLETGYVAFYISEDMVTNNFTHVVFTRMNPNYSNFEWNSEEQNDHVWAQTADLTYPGNGQAYQINGWEDGQWVAIATGVDRVEVAGGIEYANGVVAAEGAIEVYNVGGAIVARGNDNVDLRALNAGVYIVRNGDQVRKVVR